MPHSLLATKLKMYGITGKTGRWVNGFLRGRSQQVLIGNKKSSERPVTSGVPQGGVLSGTLFSLYINDLPSELDWCSISMYADDAKIYAPIKSHQDILNFQSDINKLAAWCDRWKLKINAEKCFLIQYNPRSENRKFDPVYDMNGSRISQRADTKDLGIIISEDAKFHKQVDAACAKANREIGRIRRSFICRTPQFISEMYKLYVRPHIEYCVELWNPIYSGDVQKIEKVQNRMTRLLRQSAVLAPTERNNMLRLTTHEERRRRGDMIATYKNIENSNLFTLRSGSRTRGNDRKLELKNYRHDVIRQSFNHRVVNNWNQLPNYVVNSTSINQFKTNYDRYFFNAQ